MWINLGRPIHTAFQRSSTWKPTWHKFLCREPLRHVNLSITFSPGLKARLVLSPLSSKLTCLKVCKTTEWWISVGLLCIGYYWLMNVGYNINYDLILHSEHLYFLLSESIPLSSDNRKPSFHFRSYTAQALSPHPWDSISAGANESWCISQSTHGFHLDCLDWLISQGWAYDPTWDKRDNPKPLVGTAEEDSLPFHFLRATKV